MRYVRMFFIYFQHVLQNRDRIFVWFLMSLFGPLLSLLFWKGATSSGSTSIPWNFSEITTYYLLMVLIYSALMAHIEEDISKRDIREGQLVNYILKPFSYYKFKFFEEVVYRILQGSFAFIVILGISMLFPKAILLNLTIEKILLAAIIICLAFFIAFTFKMIVGLISLWIIDIGGLYQLVEIILLTFAGLMVPLSFFPEQLEIIAKILPFSYMIYYPIIAIQGLLNIPELLLVIVYQVLWLTTLSIIYLYTWKKGIKKFTAVGQ